MAYLGILNGLLEINGKEVDLSQLDEGKVIAGDEVIDADDLITDEDRLAVFNEGALKTKDEILKDIDFLLREIDENSKTDPKHSREYYTRYVGLIERFRAEVEKRVFPAKLEDWWQYEYDVRETGVTLTLSHVDYFDIGSNDIVSATQDTTFNLLTVKARFLTVEQYAQAYDVTTTTVRQWIRRGKIHTAIKRGSEWRIPELAEAASRGYKYRQYEREEYLTDLPAEYAFFNDYDYVSFEQDDEHKDMFNVVFSKEYDANTVTDEEEIRKTYKEMQMGRIEREKFELYLISNPFVIPESIYITSRG